MPSRKIPDAQMPPHALFDSDPPLYMSHFSVYFDMMQSTMELLVAGRMLYCMSTFAGDKGDRPRG